MHHYHNLWLLLLLLLSILVPGCKPALPASRTEGSVFAIKNVNVITMTSQNEVLENATVVIKDNLIESINAPVPDNAQIIDGKGKWVIPGLIDMHVHIPTDGHFNTTYPTRAAVTFSSTQDVMTPFVANGVTTVLELISSAGHFGQRNEILRGDVIGPRMALAAMLNGGKEPGRIANTPSDGRQSVRMAKAEGYEFIKVYSQLDTETFSAICDEAGKQGMKVAGHIPNAFQGKLEEAFVPNFNMVAHTEELTKHSKDYSDADAHRFAKLAKDNGTWLTATLIVMERIADQSRSLDSVANLEGFQYVHPLLQNKWLTANKNFIGTSPERVANTEQKAAFNMKLVKAFKEAGVPIVAGTDAGASGVIWGYSLHDELALLVAAGLTPEEALVSATRLPAKWLGLEDKIGTVEAGKFADLVLLDANPLGNIKNTKKIYGVFFNGRWLNRAAIDTLLSDLEKRNTAAKGKFEWSKRSTY